MRHYEGVIGLSNLNADLKERQLARNLFVIDRFLKQISAAGIAPGQPTATGAGGGSAQPCCVNEVDEFEIVNDATEGILSFGRAEGDATPEILSGHTYTRIEGWEHGTQINLNGDTTAGSVSVQTTTKRTGSYALQITNDGVTASNLQFAFTYDGNGQPTTTTTFAAVAFRFYMRFSALPDATREIFKLWGSSVGALRTVVSMTSGGILVLDATSGTTALATNTWYKITGTYDSVTNKVFLFIDDTVEFNNVTAAGSGGAGVVLKLSWGKTANAGTYTMFVDDVALEGAAAIASVTYPPSAGIYDCPVEGNGLIQDVFAIGGSTPPATRWEAVKTPHDGDVSHIGVTGGTDVASTYILNVPVEVRGKIHAVQWANIFKTETAVNTTHRVITAASDAIPEASVTLITTGATSVTTTGYRLAAGLRASNPFSSAAWTREAIEAMVIGAQVTPGAGVTTRISTISIQVEVSEENGADVARAIRVTPEDGHIIPAYLVNDGDLFGLSNWARLVAGQDGTNCQILLTDTSGRLVTVGGGGITVDLADDSTFTIATSRVVPMGALADETTTDSVDEGDIGVPRMTLDRKLLTGSDHTDDANFTIVTGKVSVIGGLADELATDSVDEGDVGAIRMTLDRKLLTGADHTDDAAFGVATGKVSVVGLLADESGTDSVDEGDVGAARMTLDRRAHVKNTDFAAGAQITTDGRTAPTTTEVYVDIQAKDPGANTVSRVSCEVANLNDDGTTSDRGLHISDITKYFRQTLTALNTTYDDSPTTASSASIDCSRFRKFLFLWTVTRANAPTDIQVKAEFSNDGGTTWFQYRNNFWGQLLYDDTAIPTSGTTFSRCYSGDCVGDFLRFTIVCQGTTASATFTVTNATCILKN